MKSKTIYIPLKSVPPVEIYCFSDFLCGKLLEVAASVNTLNEDYKCDFFMGCFEIPLNKVHGICITYSNPYLFENFSKAQMNQIIRFLSRYVESQILPKCLKETTQASSIANHAATHHRIDPQKNEEMLKKLRKELENVFQRKKH